MSLEQDAMGLVEKWRSQGREHEERSQRRLESGRDFAGHTFQAIADTYFMVASELEMLLKRERA